MSAVLLHKKICWHLEHELITTYLDYKCSFHTKGKIYSSVLFSHLHELAAQRLAFNLLDFVPDSQVVFNLRRPAIQLYYIHYIWFLFTCLLPAWSQSCNTDKSNPGFSVPPCARRSCGTATRACSWSSHCSACTCTWTSELPNFPRRPSLPGTACGSFLCGF